MTAPTPLERLEQALAELGALTPDGIADLMRAKGIKAKRRDTCFCALAQYLSRMGLGRVTVAPQLDTGPDGRWYARADDGKTCTSKVWVPESVAEFARRFDQGVYLDLAVAFA